MGAHWNVAIMDSIGEGEAAKLAVVSGGPFRWIRHPNYLAVFLELLALPLVHAAWLTAGLGSLAHLWVLRHRIRAEERALLTHSSYQSVMSGKPRFVPRPILTMLARLGALIRLGRPLFLVGGFLLYGLGVAAAAGHGSAIDPTLFVLGLAAVASFQLMTHYANDYFDYPADCLNLSATRWSGGSRVLVRGELPRGAGLIVALLAAGAGLAVTGLLAMRGSAGPVAPLLLVIALLSWAYSAPPLRLHSTGFGELDCTLVVTGLVPLFAFQLHAHGLAPSRELLLAIAPLCCLQFAMLVAVSVPDAAGDAAAGKRTLVVRLGSQRAVRLQAAAVVLAYGSLPALHAAGLPGAVALAAAVPAPLALWQVTRMRAGRSLQPGNWEAYTFWSAALLVLTAAAEIAGFMVG
ncbi:MAG TPA: UbiA family prenyltransferase, partial [Polyangia bacterium]